MWLHPLRARLACCFALCSLVAPQHWLPTPSLAFWYHVLALRDALPALRALLQALRDDPVQLGARFLFAFFCLTVTGAR